MGSTTALALLHSHTAVTAIIMFWGLFCNLFSKSTKLFSGLKTVSEIMLNKYFLRGISVSVKVVNNLIHTVKSGRKSAFFPLLV